MKVPSSGCRTLRAFLAATLLAVGARPAVGQTQSVPGYRLRLLGLFDEQTGAPLEGVKVSDVLGRTSTVTGKAGIVSLVFLPEGTSIVRLKKLGFESLTMAVTISPADTMPLTIVMRHVVELAAVVTTALAGGGTQSSRLAAFRERQKSGAGYFIDDNVLRKNEAEQLTDLMRSHMPGAAFADVNGRPYLVQSPRCIDGTHAGPPQVYLDGIAIDPDPMPTHGGSALATDKTPFDLSRFQVSDLAGVEWYPDGTMLPIEFDHTSGRCGALLLWTR